MAGKSQIATSVSQSKLLLAAGIDPKSADMYYKNNLPWTDKEPKYSAILSVGSPVEALEWYNKGYTAAGKEPLSLFHFCFPAWSLSKLWDMLDTGWRSLLETHTHSSKDIIEKLVRLHENLHTPLSFDK